MIPFLHMPRWSCDSWPLAVCTRSENLGKAMKRVRVLVTPVLCIPVLRRECVNTLQSP